jgi:hypothetical protein
MVHTFLLFFAFDFFKYDERKFLFCRFNPCSHGTKILSPNQFSLFLVRSDTLILLIADDNFAYGSRKGLIMRFLIAA